MSGPALVVKRAASLQGFGGGADLSPCDASATSGYPRQLGSMRPAGGFPRAAEAARPRKLARTTHFNDEATLFIYTPVTLASSTDGSDNECDGRSPPDGSPVAVAASSIASRQREGDAAGSVGPLRSQGGAVASHSVMGVGSVVAARPRQAPPVFLVRLSAPGREGAAGSGLPDPSAAATKPAGVPPFENQAGGKGAAMSTSSFGSSDLCAPVPAAPARLPPPGEGTPASPPGGEPFATAAPAPLSASAPSGGGAPSRLPAVVPRGGVERPLLMADSPTSTCSAGSARAMAETPAGAAAALPGAPPKLVRGGEPIGAASAPAADTRSAAAGLPVAPPPPIRSALGGGGGAPSLSNLRISAYPGACPPENRAATEYDESLTVPAAEARLASLAQSEAYRQSLRAGAPPRIGLSIATPHSTAPPLLLRPVPPPTAVRDPGASKNRGGDDGSAAHASRRADGAATSRLSQFDKGRHPIPVRYEEDSSRGASSHAPEGAASSGSATRRTPSSRADAACLSRIADCDCCSPCSSALPLRVGDMHSPAPLGPEVHVAASSSVPPEPDSGSEKAPLAASSRPSAPDMDLAE